MTADDELDLLLERCTFDHTVNARAERPELTCAVSGGPDSAALLVLACRHAQQVGTRVNAVRAVHVDHGIRADGDAEAARVQALCDRVGASLRVERLRVADGPNLQARARAARAGALGPDALLGHTADDQAETVLLQLLRGGALDALAAMRPDKRPLLGLRRGDTERVCELVGYEPIRDPSNADRRYWRSRVRHEVLPLLCDVAGRDVVPVLARAAGMAAAEADLLDALAADIDPSDASELRAAPPAVARRAVRAWLRTEHPPDASAVERVLDVARHTRRATEVAGGRRVARSADRLRIEP
ncbi:tRNA lysidine(34) synthetase TilS [Candidatus Poriferisodalis sp.]|uniref:tRNA lysidine(34) synthetase TilS n=1 Tax=Candidatus Poriferisodalis sp. TaxID=3101277 RepID=UPI003B0187CA